MSDLPHIPLAELQAIEAEHAADDVSILAAGDEWLLTVMEKVENRQSIQKTYRAQRVAS